MSGLSLDTSSLESALVFVEMATGRSMAESMNRAGLHAIIGSGTGPGAMQLTPKASRSAIAAVPDKQIAGFVIKKAKRLGQWPLSSVEIARRVKKERQRRASSSGYAAYAGWNNAAKAMGGRGIRKGVTEAFARSEAARGGGSKASPGDLTASIRNTAPAAEKIGFAALQEGLDNAARDLIEYGTRKMQGNFNKVKP